MVQRGAMATFKGDKCEIFRNLKILAMGEIQGKLYTVKIVKEHVNIAKQQPDADKYLWHCRSGHLGMNNVNKLTEENMASGMDGANQ